MLVHPSWRAAYLVDRLQLSFGVSSQHRVNPAQRVVTQLPLVELWDDRGPIAARREQSLTTQQLRVLIQGPPVRFVVADAGLPLRWIPEAERFVFWKAEVRPRLVEHPEHPIDVFVYPEGRAFVASEWVTDDLVSSPIVLLECYH